MNQNALQLFRYLPEAYGNRFVMMGSNYIYPYETNRILADLVTQARGRILDEFDVPLDADAEDFSKPIRIGTASDARAARCTGASAMRASRHARAA